MNNVNEKKTAPMLRAVFFLIPLLVMLCLLSMLFVPKDNREESGMEEIRANGILAEPENSIDVLIVGDSETYASFSPVQIWEEQGITSYVCGSSAQRLYQSYEYLEKALKRQHPKLVVLEANAIFREQGLEKALFDRFARVLPVLRYHDRWKGLQLRDLNPEINYTFTTQYKGYRFKYVIKDGTKPGYMEKEDAKSQKIARDNRFYLSKIKKLCEKAGIEFILVSVPSTENWNRTKHETVSAYAEKNGLTYLDMNLLNDAVGIDWTSDTCDAGDHLNIYGAKKTSTFFGTWLTENYQLERHDGDDISQIWDDLITPYHQEWEKKSGKSGAAE